MWAEAFAQVAVGVLAGSLVATFACLVVGLRTPEWSARLAGVCASLGVLVLVGGVVSYLLAMSDVHASVAVALPSERATILARGISEAMNCAALFAVAVVPPGFGALVLFIRSRSKLRTV